MTRQRLVLDANVAVKLILAEADTPLANAVASQAAALFAPEVIFAEVANALWVNLTRGDATLQQATEGLVALAPVFVETRPSAELAREALTLSLELNHPVYDCLYLALAIEIDARVVTTDRRFLQKVAASRHAGRLISLQEAAS